MYFDTTKDCKLDKVWEMILNRLGDEAQEVCASSSSFYRTQDGIECALRKINGDLFGICYREKNRASGYRWTINKN